MAEYKDLDRKVIKLAKQVVRMCAEAGTGHTSSSLSLAHLVTALMYRVMRYDPRNPWNQGADRLILSEGHAVPIVYAAYCDIGGFVGAPHQPSELRFSDALTLRAADSVLDGHPNPAIGMPFFDAATGSLGQGLSVAAGLALGAKMDDVKRRFYCICGDGESREGQVWEALDFIVDHNLTAVRAIFNCNGLGQSDAVSPQQSLTVLQAKLAAFGFDVKVIDGHDWNQVFDALTAEPGDKPIAILARTVKGWGVAELQPASGHGKALAGARIEAALSELDQLAGTLGVAEVPDSPCVALKAPLTVTASPTGPISCGSFADALKAVGMDKALESRTIATRNAWAAAMVAIARDPRVISVDADMRHSTAIAPFVSAHPKQFVEAKIAEQNMISMASGLSSAGKIPFTSTFAKFLVRAYDQVEMATVTAANIKMIGSHSGVSLAADGPSQMGLPDLAFMRSFAHTRRLDGEPGIRVFQPSDGVSAFKLTERMANAPGMCYMRTHRPDVPLLYSEDEEFGDEGFKLLIDGEDLVILSSGYMVHVAKQACEILEKRAGLSAGLIDAYALPLDAAQILQIGDDCRGQILVVEDNFVGGFGDEIAAAAASSDLGVMVERMFVDRTPKSGRSPEDLLKMLNLTAEDVAATAQRIFDRSEG